MNNIKLFLRLKIKATLIQRMTIILQKQKPSKHFQKYIKNEKYDLVNNFNYKIKINDGSEIIVISTYVTVLQFIGISLIRMQTQ